MNRRALGVALIIVSLCVCVGSAYRMAGRVVAFNKAAAFEEFGFEPIGERAFSAYGRPVTLVDGEPKGGLATIRMTYGDGEWIIPVKSPPAKDIPTLELYDEWLKVLWITRVRRDSDGNRITTGEPQSLYVITRLPATGYDEETWGKVRRADQTFRFYEILPDGGVDETVWRWPRSEKSEKGLQRRAEANPDDESLTRLVSISPLKERSLEYMAATHVMPKIGLPKLKFNDTAVWSMGWTLPVGAFSGLLVLVGIMLAARPSKVTRYDQE